MVTDRALAQQTLDFEIDGVTGSHMGNRHQMESVLLLALTQAFPTVDAFYGLPEPITESDIRKVLQDEGLLDRVSFEFGQFPQ